MINFGSLSCLLAVSALWGLTNPLMKKHSEGLEKVNGKGIFGQFFAEVWFILSNRKNLMTFAANQSGSFIFYMALGEADLTTAVMVTNSLTFVFTSFAGYLLGEKSLSKGSYAGITFVLIGLSICVYEQSRMSFSATSSKT